MIGHLRVTEPARNGWHPREMRRGTGRLRSWFHARAFGGMRCEPSASCAVAPTPSVGHMYGLQGHSVGPAGPPPLASPPPGGGGPTRCADPIFLTLARPRRINGPPAGPCYLRGVVRIRGGGAVGGSVPERQQGSCVLGAGGACPAVFSVDVRGGYVDLVPGTYPTQLSILLATPADAPQPPSSCGRVAIVTERAGSWRQRAQCVAPSLAHGSRAAGVCRSCGSAST